MQLAQCLRRDGRRFLQHEGVRRLEATHPGSRITAWELLLDNTIVMCVDANPGGSSSAGRGVPAAPPPPANDVIQRMPCLSVRRSLRLQVGGWGVGGSGCSCCIILCLLVCVLEAQGVSCFLLRHRVLAVFCGGTGC